MWTLDYPLVMADMQGPQLHKQLSTKPWGAILNPCNMTLGWGWGGGEGKDIIDQLLPEKNVHYRINQRFCSLRWNFNTFAFKVHTFQNLMWKATWTGHYYGNDILFLNKNTWILNKCNCFIFSKPWQPEGLLLDCLESWYWPHGMSTIWSEEWQPHTGDQQGKPGIAREEKQLRLDDGWVVMTGCLKDMNCPWSEAMGSHPGQVKLAVHCTWTKNIFVATQAAWPIWIALAGQLWQSGNTKEILPKGLLQWTR